MFAAGNLRVTRIVEQQGWGSFAADLFPQFDAARIAGLPWLSGTLRDVPGRGVQLHSSFHSWLVQTGPLKILIAPCADNGRNRPNNPRFHQFDTPWPSRLRAARAAPGVVDLVICTHLHCDHCGWNTNWQDGYWQPTFPRAR